jgi:hypothetical protein
MPMSLAIWRSNGGEMSRPLWLGTVVPRPSGWRYWMWDPRWRATMKPWVSRRLQTSRGLRMGGFDMGSCRNSNALGANKLGFHLRLAVFEKHRDYFLQVELEFIKGFTLGVGSGKTGDVTHIKPGVRAAFDDSGVGFQGSEKLDVGDGDCLAVAAVAEAVNEKNGCSSQ